MIKKGILAGIAVACGCFAFLNKDRFNKRYNEYRLESQLIRWSKDGSDFLGPASVDHYKELNGKRYVSPNRSMVVCVYWDNITISTKKGDAYTYKCLHPDGNTKTYVERQDKQLNYNSFWDENGNEINFLHEKEDRSCPY